MTRDQRYKVFRALHERDGAFVIPNPWNAGTARILTTFGSKRLQPRALVTPSPSDARPRRKSYAE